MLVENVFLKKKKKQKNMLCICLGHLPRALLPGCGVHQVCPAHSQNSDEGLLCSSFQMMWLASVCRMERSWLFWPPWLNLQRTAYTPRVEENTEVRFHLCPSCLTLIKPLLSSAPSSSTSFNFSHLWGHCIIKDLAWKVVGTAVVVIDLTYGMRSGNKKRKKG